MPRPTRLSLAGHAHHVIQRGNNRQPVFFDDHDRVRYLEWLAAGLAAEGCRLHAYVLMTNHVHLLLTAGAADSVGRLMQSLGRRYVGHVNRAYGRTGTLWEGRYKATVLDSDAYLLACMRYIETNPLRARMVAAPEDHRWSSYRANALGRADALIAPHAVYLALGGSPQARRTAYRALFAEGLDDDLLAELRDSVQRGWVPGSARFRAEIAAVLGRAVDPPRRGRPPKDKAVDEGMGKNESDPL